MYQAVFENIEAIKQTLSSIRKKSFKCTLAKNIVAKLHNELSKEGALELYGETLKYKKSTLVK